MGLLVTFRRHRSISDTCCGSEKAEASGRGFCVTYRSFQLKGSVLQNGRAAEHKHMFTKHSNTLRWHRHAPPPSCNCLPQRQSFYKEGPRSRFSPMRPLSPLALSSVGYVCPPEDIHPPDFPSNKHRERRGQKKNACSELSFERLKTRGAARCCSGYRRCCTA